jgi:hypothetical protein
MSEPGNAAASSDQVVYNTYYTMYMLQNVNLYLSWSNIANFWAYLYDSPKSLWFVKVGGENSGPVLTGDTLQVVINVGQSGGLKGYLYCRGLNDWTVAWNSSTSSTAATWSIWTDEAMTPGLPIALGQTVYLTNRDPSYAGNFLIQYLPQYPDYLTVGPATVPCQFQILADDSALSADEPNARRSPPPPDTQEA